MNTKKISIYLYTIVLLWSVPAFAIPVLQLDIDGGIYYNGPTGTVDTQTTIALEHNFTLYALLTPRHGEGLTNYYLSAALFPATAQYPVPSLGSVKINGISYGVASDFNYGTPPRDSDEGDLQKHGIFSTYYLEFGFDFQGDQTTDSYNVQNYPGGLRPNPNRTDDAFYVAFNIDTTYLNSDYSIHFDLYHANNGTVDYFAPFSHDAHSDPPPVPEPATLVLFGSGLIGLAGIGRRKFKS